MKKVLTYSILKNMKKVLTQYMLTLCRDLKTFINSFTIFEINMMYEFTYKVEH